MHELATTIKHLDRLHETVSLPASLQNKTNFTWNFKIYDTFFNKTERVCPTYNIVLRIEPMYNFWNAFITKKKRNYTTIALYAYVV